ncbi:hypothetical protein M885DRAFT_624540 [Pelagophyceae sp. CCMP2097]|nr:hypothetical protein M885DRAFT_624540 [Pelagophyceae sp. CCMP2097]
MSRHPITGRRVEAHWVSGVSEAARLRPAVAPGCGARPSAERRAPALALTCFGRRVLAQRQRRIRHQIDAYWRRRYAAAQVAVAARVRSRLARQALARLGVENGAARRVQRRARGGAARTRLRRRREQTARVLLVRQTIAALVAQRLLRGRRGRRIAKARRRARAALARRGAAEVATRAAALKPHFKKIAPEHRAEAHHDWLAKKGAEAEDRPLRHARIVLAAMSPHAPGAQAPPLGGAQRALGARNDASPRLAATTEDVRQAHARGAVLPALAATTGMPPLAARRRPRRRARFDDDKARPTDRHEGTQSAPHLPSLDPTRQPRPRRARPRAGEALPALLAAEERMYRRKLPAQSNAGPGGNASDILAAYSNLKVALPGTPCDLADHLRDGLDDCSNLLKYCALSKRSTTRRSSTKVYLEASPLHDQMVIIHGDKGIFDFASDAADTAF